MYFLIRKSFTANFNFSEKNFWPEIQFFSELFWPKIQTVHNFPKFPDGDFFPKGVRIIVMPLLLQRNPLIFDNPNQYNPENFSEDKIGSRHAYSDIPFSAGPRNCIGQKFAMMEEKAVISWFFRKYRVTASQPFGMNKILPELILKSSLGFPLTVHHRTDNK